MFKLLSQERIAPLHLGPGDTLRLTADGEVLLEEPITEAVRVDTIGTFVFRGQFGLKKGIGGYFGESLDKRQ